MKPRWAGRKEGSYNSSSSEPLLVKFRRARSSVDWGTVYCMNYDFVHRTVSLVDAAHVLSNNFVHQTVVTKVRPDRPTLRWVGGPDYG